MDPTKDIRNVFQLGLNKENIHIILLNNLPPGTPRAETSGFDCLVVVIRLIYSVTRLDHPINILNRDFESENGILAYAWKILGSPFPVESEELDEVLLLDKCQAMCAGTDGKASFASLIDLKPMHRTLWDLPEFNIFHETVRRHDSRNLIDYSTIYVDRKPTLQDSADSLLEDAMLLPHVKAEVPKVLRASFESRHHPSLRFRDLRTFGLSYMGYDDDFDEVVFNPERKYLLRAVVRLRNTPDEPDYVRTYRPSGHYIVPTIKEPTFMNDEWIIEPPHTFWLFYTICPVYQTIFEDVPEVERNDIDGGGGFANESSQNEQGFVNDWSQNEQGFLNGSFQNGQEFENGSSQNGQGY